MVTASILHGAYGDYYEQALCLKHWRRTHPERTLKLFFASQHRMRELAVLDWSWADGVFPAEAMATEPFDDTLQFQVRDDELRAEVLDHLPPAVRARVDEQTQRLPWTYLRPFLPLADPFQLGLSDEGRRRMPELMRQSGVDENIFARPTVGFLWRFREAGGAVRPPMGATDPMALAAKYSEALRRLIARFDCHVLVAGMKVKTTDENRHRVDRKFPEYGLDLPPERSVHLQGLSWVLEMELVARCDLSLCNPSGFSEAVWLRGAHVMLLDPPAHYLAKLARHRMPLFEYLTLRGFADAWRPQSVDWIVRRAADRLSRRG